LAVKTDILFVLADFPVIWS